MENIREETVKKFCTNCDESCDNTAKTPASLKIDANPSDMDGKANVAARAANIDGMPTRTSVTSCVELGSTEAAPPLFLEAAKVPERDDAMFSQMEREDPSDPSSLLLLSGVDDEETKRAG